MPRSSRTGPAGFQPLSGRPRDRAEPDRYPLAAQSKATLAGTLKVSTGNGFVPSHGEAFSVLPYHTHSGTFSTLTGTPAYSVSYTATAAKVVYP
jgi:hypothetical protein